MEIGGQDSKIILMRRRIVADFGMNTVCAAGTGSFLDHQAARLGIAIEEFGDRALRSRNPVRITGRCTVFAESDMIQKQQTGHRTEDILYGLCQALARNYLSNVGLGKEIRTPVVFQGGVAFNRGVVRAFKEALETEDVIVPPHQEAMGAIGAALLAAEEMRRKGSKTLFKGFEVSDAEYTTTRFECEPAPTSARWLRYHWVGRSSPGAGAAVICGSGSRRRRQRDVAQGPGAERLRSECQEQNVSQGSWSW